MLDSYWLLLHSIFGPLFKHLFFDHLVFNEKNEYVLPISVQKSDFKHRNIHFQIKRYLRSQEIL